MCGRCCCCCLCVCTACRHLFDHRQPRLRKPTIPIPTVPTVVSELGLFEGQWQDLRVGKIEGLHAGLRIKRTQHVVDTTKP
jgi:hypothetical protein